MANILKRVTGTASIAGTVVHTVPASTTLTIIGLRASNNDTVDHTVHFKIANTLVCGLDTPLPVGSAIDVMVGSKIVAQAGDQIVAFSDANSKADVFISFLEQS